jgi:hypothetical protein
VILGSGIRITSTYHPQSNGGEKKFNKTLIESLRTYVSHRQDNWVLHQNRSPKTVEVELDGSSWYQVEDILDHRGKAGPMCECLVRWKDFDVSHDSWVRCKLLTPFPLQGYDQFLTEHVRFCEEPVKNSKLPSQDVFFFWSSIL